MLPHDNCLLDLGVEHSSLSLMYLPKESFGGVGLTQEMSSLGIMQVPTREPELRGMGTRSEVDAVGIDRASNKAVIGFDHANIRQLTQIDSFVKQLEKPSNFIQEGADSPKRLQGFNLGVALMAKTFAPKLSPPAIAQQCQKHGFAMFKRSRIATRLTKPVVLPSRGFLKFHRVGAFLR